MVDFSGMWWCSYSRWKAGMHVKPSMRSEPDEYDAHAITSDTLCLLFKPKFYTHRLLKTLIVNFLSIFVSKNIKEKNQTNYEIKKSQESQ